VKDNFQGGFGLGEAYKWINGSRKNKNLEPCSELGQVVAEILGRVYRGIYNMPATSGWCDKDDWSSNRCIAITVWGGLSTYDFCQLSDLVILSHDACVRIELNPKGFKYLELVFHPRNRSGSLPQRMPSMEEAIARVRPEVTK